MKIEEVPLWIVDCVMEMHDCEDMEVEEAFDSDHFRSDVEIITNYYLETLDGQRHRVHIERPHHG